MKRISGILIGLVLAIAAMGQNNPYVDDRVFHFGFSLGLNLQSFGVTDSRDTINGEVYHARVSTLLPGFSVGFISDFRLSRHLSLRINPGLEFSSRTLSYLTESGAKAQGSPGHGSTTDVLAIPVIVPVYLKWAAEREKNYRPYLLGGGGFAYNVSIDKERPVQLKPIDVFAEVGAGCDLYFQWFKFCPQITYRIGFLNQIAPIEAQNILPADYFYSQAIKRLFNQSIVLTFNFE